MKKAAVLITVILCLTPFLITGQNKVTKTFAKTFQLANENEILFEPSDSVQIFYTDNPQQVRLLLFIEAYNTSNEMLKSLSESGRYLIKTQSLNGQLFVSLPFIKNSVILNSSPLKESHYFVLYAPKNMSVSHAKQKGKVSIVDNLIPQK